MPTTKQTKEHKHHWRLGRLIIAGFVTMIATGVLVWLAWPGSGAGSSGDKLKVVAAENFWGDVARQIGSNRVDVTSIISDPSADPHLYESNADNAAAVSSAQVVIANGLGYDDFMTKLLGTGQTDDRQVVTAANVVDAASSANPHLWYKLSYVQSVAAAIAAAYEKADDVHADTYRRNLTTFNMSLQPLYNTSSEIRSHFSGAAVAYTERVPEYLLKDIGVTVKTPAGFAEAIENGNDPSPGDTTTMQKLISAKTIKVLVYNAQATSPVTESLKTQAQDTHIPVVGVTETLPVGMTFQQWQQSQLDKLLAALETK